MRDALRLIIAKSPAAINEAMDCLRAIQVKSPIVQRRYENTARLAFSDPQAAFTPEERELIASHLAGEDEGGTKQRNIRLSDEDWRLAQQIGDGNAAAGIRAALRACQLSAGHTCTPR